MVLLSFLFTLNYIASEKPWRMRTMFVSHVRAGTATQRRKREEDSNQNKFYLDFGQKSCLPHMNKSIVLVTWRTLVLCRVYIFALCQSAPEIFVVTVSRFVLEKQLPPPFLKIGLLFRLFHHNFVIFKVTAIQVCMLQAYTNSLVFVNRYLYPFSSVCAIKCFRGAKS